MNTTAETTGTEPAAAAPPPLIVWSLQRTGGKHLTQQLLAVCGLPAAEHEPFKVGSAFGRVTADWVQHKDEARLREAVRAICQRRISIQHDIEGVHWPLLQCLMEESSAAGYSHLLVHRQRALDRLLSLHFMRENGLWEPDSPTNAAVRNYVFAQPLPVAKLVQHERYCVDLLHRLWALANDLGKKPVILAFEAVFRSDDEEAAQARLLSTFDALGLSRRATADREAARQLLGTIKPIDPNRYQRFAGASKLAAALTGVPGFAPSVPPAPSPAPDAAPPLATAPAMAMARLLVTPLNTGHPWIAHAVIDSAPETFPQALPVKIGGLVVLSSTAPRDVQLAVEIAGKSTKVWWQNPSPKMKLQFPDSPNSGNARFQINGTLPVTNARLMLQVAEPGEPDLPLFDLRAVPASM